MSRTLTTLALLYGLFAAMAALGGPARADEGDGQTGSDHGDEISWPCPEIKPIA